MRPDTPVTITSPDGLHLAGIAMTWKAAFAENVKKETILNLVRTPGQTTLIALSNGNVVGFVTVVKAAQSGRHRIDYIAVHPIDAPKLTAPSLLRAAEGLAIDDGSTEMTLAVRRSNKRAIQFYERNGYEILEERPAGFTYRKALA